MGMKYSIEDIEKLNFRDAFPPMPEDFRQKLKETLMNYQEEKKAIHIPIHVIIIAALITLLMTSVGYAAGKLGWFDYFANMFGIHVTEQTQNAMEASKIERFVVGPLIFDIKELFSDGRIALGSADIKTSNGKGLFIDDPGQLRSQTNEPCYMARFLMEVDESYHGNGEEIEDYILSGRGITYLNMIPVLLDQDIDTISATARLTVDQINPQNGEILQSWSKQEILSIPVDLLMTTKEYVPDSKFVISGMNLQKVIAEQTIAGVYLKMLFQAEDNLLPDNILIPDLCWINPNEDVYERGINLALEIKKDAWPQIIISDMITTDRLPEQLIILNLENGEAIMLKQTNQ